MREAQKFVNFTDDVPTDLLKKNAL